MTTIDSPDTYTGIADLEVSLADGVLSVTLNRPDSLNSLTAPMLKTLADTLDRAATDPRVRVVFDDARHFILTTREKFDIITSDPIHPWIKGSASLYTKEYYNMVKSHLNPGGVIAQWVPLYESTVDTVKSEIATFFDIYPQGTTS